MECSREKSPSRLARDLGGRRRRATVRLSGPPTPQTSLIFELPDELILSILSYISPDPQLINDSHHARFRVQYGMAIDDNHQQRVWFLLQLSMTCMAMRSRLLPWIWERLECLEVAASWSSDGRFPKRLNAIIKALEMNTSLATCVRSMTVLVMWNNSTIPKFVKCLESLPNLHTLEIGRTNDHITAPLKKALQRVELPQIKALILPPAAYPLLRHCRDVEDVVCVVRSETMSSDKFLGSLASGKESKVKRLAIPLVSSGNPSQYVAAFPRLSELTAIYPAPRDAPVTAMGVLLETVGAVRSTTLKLINACKVLPDFDTFQIVHLLPATPSLGCVGTFRGISYLAATERRKQDLGEQVDLVRDWAMEYLKKAKSECQERDGGKKVMLRVIGLGLDRPTAGFYVDHAKVQKVEEYEVWGSGIEDPQRVQ